MSDNNNKLSEQLSYIYSLSDEDKFEYLKQEVDKVITNSKHPLKLLALQAKCDRIRRTHKDPVACHVAMKSVLLEHLLENY